MSIYTLGVQNFGLIDGSMNINVGGLLLVLFKMQGSQESSALESIFAKLPSKNPHVKYAVCDLTYNRNVIDMSRSSTTVIQKPPVIILYVDRKPFALFKGSKDLTSLDRFVINALKALQEQRAKQQPTFSQPPPQQNMYGGPPQQRGNSAYIPEIGNMNSKTAKASGMHQSLLKQQVDDEDDSSLKMPDNVIPHNLPWESDIVKLIESGKI